MTDCNPELVRFPRCKGREVEARFSGGAITSYGGAVLHNTRRVQLLLSSSCPHQALFFAAAAHLRLG